MTSLIVAVILMATVTMLVTRPGAAGTISRILGYGSSSIKGMLGT